MTALKPVTFSAAKPRAPRISPHRVIGRQSSRFWTDEQKEIVRRYFPGGGFAACAAHLPPEKQTRSGIYAMAHKLGIAAETGRGGGPKAKLELPSNLDDLIREFYQNGDGKKRGECNAFADSIKVPRWVVTKRAIKLGLTIPHSKEPPWTAAETELMAKVPLHDVNKCAKIFREHGFQRSPSAIMVRAKRLGISRRFNEGLSAIAAARIVGFDAKNFGSMLVRGECVAVKRDDKRSPQQGGSRWVIKREDLRRFVLENLERIDLRKVDKFEFVHLIANEPPRDAVR